MRLHFQHIRLLSIYNFRSCSNGYKVLNSAIWSQRGNCSLFNKYNSLNLPLLMFYDQLLKLTKQATDAMDFLSS